MRCIKLLCAMLCVVLVLASCASRGIEENLPEPTNMSGETIKIDTIAPTPIPSEDPLDKKQIDTAEQIDEYISKLAPERKLGMLLMIAIPSSMGGGTSISPEIEDQIKDIGPCGVILFGHNISLEQTLKDFISDMQATSEIPLFIAVDEEGGRISPLQNAYALEIKDAVPSPYEMGKLSWSDIYDYGVVLGKRLKRYGFNMNLAPSADIWTNEFNTVIGDRAFGEDAVTVSASVAPMISGLKSQRVATVLKHFPGHGDTEKDTHNGAVAVTHSEERLNTVEYKPFTAGIEYGADCVMLAHILAPEVDTSGLPASMSPYFAQTVLRGQFKFDGIIITDAMNMVAITHSYTSGEAALLAVQAGVDIVLMPEDAKEAYEALKKAYGEGHIDDAALNASVKRILMLKLRLGILDMELLS